MALSKQSSDGAPVPVFNPIIMTSIARKIALGIISIATAFSLWGCEESGVFVYKDNLENSRLIVDLRKGEVSDGHLVWKMTNCDPSLYCFTSPVLEFGAPRTGISGNSAWTFNKLEYKVVGVRSVELLGTSVEAFLIHQTVATNRYWFLYSEKKGLIGMGAFSAKKPSFYWVSGACGFGASERC
jgi:hypothetical protein